MESNFLTDKERFLLTVEEPAFFEYIRKGLGLDNNSTREDIKKADIQKMLELKEHEVCKIPLFYGGALFFTFAEMFEIWKLKQINAQSWNQERK